MKERAFLFAKDMYTRWKKVDCARMAAALSYYTAFSLAPLMILLIGIAGLAWGREAVEGHMVEQLQGLVGLESAMAIQSMIGAAWQPSKGIVATVCSIVGLLTGATGVLVELKHALNRIWDARERSSLSEVIKERALFLGMILAIGFLLMVSLAISAALSAVGKWMHGVLPVPEFLLHIVDFILSFGLMTFLFSLLFKLLPNVKLSGYDVVGGAGITALFFILGKCAIGLYLGKGVIGSSYGAAGSLLVILLWLYYSALMFYGGAIFTKVYMDHRSRI